MATSNQTTAPKSVDFDYAEVVQTRQDFQKASAIFHDLGMDNVIKMAGTPFKLNAQQFNNLCKAIGVKIPKSSEDKTELLNKIVQDVRTIAQKQEERIQRKNAGIANEEEGEKASIGDVDTGDSFKMNAELQRRKNAIQPIAVELLRETKETDQKVKFGWFRLYHPAVDLLKAELTFKGNETDKSDKETVGGFWSRKLRTEIYELAGYKTSEYSVSSEQKASPDAIIKRQAKNQTFENSVSTVCKLAYMTIVNKIDFTTAEVDGVTKLLAPFNKVRPMVKGSDNKEYENTSTVPMAVSIKEVNEMFVAYGHATKNGRSSSDASVKASVAKLGNFLAEGSTHVMNKEEKEEFQAFVSELDPAKLLPFLSDDFVERLYAMHMKRKAAQQDVTHTNANRYAETIEVMASAINNSAANPDNRTRVPMTLAFMSGLTKAIERIGYGPISAQLIGASADAKRNANAWGFVGLAESVEAIIENNGEETKKTGTNG
jgi:hypothetical protein